MFAVPIVVHAPSMVAVFACTMALRYRWMRTPPLSSAVYRPRDIQSASTWFERSGTRTRTSTPRAAAASSAARISRSGMKYACVM
ncbi:Uncharacterised protein [Mycobacteroides abscessus]|nr:Uncharacterised protein [Mycobacteroides abscessus]